MSNEEKKRLWLSPWGYPESILVVLAIALAGYALQLSTGNIDLALMRWPVNGLVGGAMLAATMVIGTVWRKRRWVLWFSGVSFSVSLLGAMLGLTIVMGLTPQTTGENVSPHDVVSILGVNRMTTSWPFVLIYITLLFSLGVLTVRSMVPFRWRKYAFYLNHVGLWLVLFTTGFGAADLKRYVMYVQIKDDNPEWRVYNDKNEMLELPVAIYLEEFILEQYDTKLTIIDKKTGESLPEAAPEFLQLDSLRPKGELMGWKVEVLKYYPDAVRTRSEEFDQVPMPGSAPAALVRVSNTENSFSKTAWVTCGSFAQLYRKIDLDSTRSLVMTAPEPKRFASRVVVYSEYAEKPDTALIEVNKPLEHHGWMIYQYSYEEKLGKASPYSSFELVYDPWKKYVFGSFLLLVLGSLSLFIQIKKRKENAQ